MTALFLGGLVSGALWHVAARGAPKPTRNGRIICAVDEIATMTEYDSAIAASVGSLTVISFGMSWCAPCVRTSEDYISLSNEFPDSFFFKVSACLTV